MKTYLSIYLITENNKLMSVSKIVTLLVKLKINFLKLINTENQMQNLCLEIMMQGRRRISLCLKHFIRFYTRLSFCISSITSKMPQIILCWFMNKFKMTGLEDN